MATDGGPAFSRAGVLGGLPARRASTLLFAIENRTALLATRARHAMASFETERTVADREQSFLAALADGRGGATKVTIQDLDRHATGWADLVPPDVELRAALLHRVIDKYGLPVRARSLRTVLGAADPAVADAYRRQTGATLADVGHDRLPLRERLRWWRSESARKVENLPPFWLAYVLTLTETVGGGVLALPIAFAAFGPIAAALVLAIFGVINALTVAALVESITRDGNMRYGNAYFGRLIGDFLGRPGNFVAMPALFALDAVGFLVALVGFGTTIGGVIGVPAAGCAALLFTVVVVVLWRGSFDATVALAVTVGLVNLALLITISVIAAGIADPGAILAGAGTGPALDASLLELIFGVALVAYFGHTSAGHAAKVVLARDPSGRHLLAGNVAAMLTAMVLYIAFVLAVTGAVGAGALTGYQGTALTPLADRAGPVVDALGTVYVSLAVGLSAVYLGLGMYNQMGEVLAAVPLWQRRSKDGAPLADFAVRAAPLFVIFIAVVLLLNAGGISFTEPLSVIGTITLPLLGGVFPMLLIVAARRRGDRMPGRIIGPLGHPLSAALIGGLYLFSVVAFGLWIWDNPIERAAALAVGAAIVVLTIVTWRRGAFTPRTVVEYRLEPGPPAFGVVSVLSAGRPVVAAISLEETTGTRMVTGSEVTVHAPNRLHRISVTVPDGAHRELELWVHAVSPDGSSTLTPSAVDLAVAGDTRTFRIGGRRHEPVIIPLSPDPAVVTISLAAAPTTT